MARKKGTKDGEPILWLLDSLKKETDECVCWPFAKTTYGYGVIRYEGRLQGTHRVVCSMANGPPPSSSHQAAHSCGKGHDGCVNPRHIRWATRSENFADKKIHGTHNGGEKHPLSKLTEKDVSWIRMNKGILSNSRLAKDLGVSSSAISMIKSGKRWG